MQYFINYNLKKGYFLTWQPTLTANWEAASGGNRWVAPYGGGVGRIMKLGFQPVSLTAQFYGNAVHPAGTSSWTDAVANCVPVPQADPGAGKADDGTKTETTGAGACSEEVNQRRDDGPPQVPRYLRGDEKNLLPPCTRGDYRGVGGENMRGLHVFEQSCLVASLIVFCEPWAVWWPPRKSGSRRSSKSEMSTNTTLPISWRSGRSKSGLKPIQSQ